MRSEKKAFEKRQSRMRWHLKQKNPGKLRLSVCRSNKHIEVQLIDDLNGTTIVSASSRDKSIAKGSNREGAEAVGKLFAERAKGKKVKDFYFDRGGLRYHGRVQSLADSIRKSGLKF